MPSCAKLAQAWGFAYITLHKTLDQLVREGLLVRKPRRGTFVASVLRPTKEKSKRLFFILMRAGSSIQREKDPYFLHLLEGFQSALDPQGLLAAMLSVHDKVGEDLFLENFDAGQAAAVVIASGDSARLAGVLAQRHVPVVLISPHAPVPGAITLLRDEEQSARDAIGFLVARGHFRIGILLREIVKYESRIRFESLRHTMERHGLPVNPAWINNDIIHTPSWHDDYLDRYLGTPDRPSALIAPELYVTAILAAARKNGLRVPDDLTIVSYSDNRSPKYVVPSLLGDGYEYGQWASRFVYRLVYEGHDSLQPRTVYFPYTFIDTTPADRPEPKPEPVENKAGR